jgi:hypothetical protein
MADCSSISARLERARLTYDNWVNGETVSRFIDQNGESVSYSLAGMSKLEAYIAKLEGQLADCQNGGTQFAYRGPLRFTFGRKGY